MADQRCDPAPYLLTRQRPADALRTIGLEELNLGLEIVHVDGAQGQAVGLDDRDIDGDSVHGAAISGRGRAKTSRAMPSGKVTRSIRVPPRRSASRFAGWFSSRMWVSTTGQPSVP